LEFARFLYGHGMFAYPDACDHEFLDPSIKSFEDLYLREANHCVILVSEMYLERRGRIPERRMAMEKARAKRGDGYFTTLWVGDEPAPDMNGIVPIRLLIGKRNAIDAALSRISSGLGLPPELRAPELE
jgi:hypothetical protein